MKTLVTDFVEHLLQSRRNGRLDSIASMFVFRLGEHGTVRRVVVPKY